jgi:hypothetical protein
MHLNTDYDHLNQLLSIKNVTIHSGHRVIIFIEDLNIRLHGDRKKQPKGKFAM